MRKLWNLAKWGLTLGSEPQAFLSAKWVERALNRASGSKKRLWALRLLSLSPHYFLIPHDARYSGMSNREYLEAAFRDSAESREKIYDQIIKQYFAPDDRVLDYGCGPGFLAAVVAKHVKTVYAADISTGALACARVLNAAPNLQYILADDSGLSEIEDGSLDVVFSFAVVQHLSDEIFEYVLETCSRKMKSCGKLILHTHLLDGEWRSEDEWKKDRSVQGRLKFRYGLHCFGRTEESHRQMLEKHGFEQIEFKDLADVVSEKFDDICEQSLFTAIKS
ncbi:MAG: methyltransferase domain-containing protein [Acidobacteriota bacterium]